MFVVEGLGAACLAMLVWRVTMMPHAARLYRGRQYRVDAAGPSGSSPVGAVLAEPAAPGK